MKNRILIFSAALLIGTAMNVAAKANENNIELVVIDDLSDTKVVKALHNVQNITENVFVIDNIKLDVNIECILSEAGAPSVEAYTLTKKETPAGPAIKRKIYLLNCSLRQFHSRALIRSV